MIYLTFIAIALNLSALAVYWRGPKGKESWLMRFFMALGFATILFCGLAAGAVPEIWVLVLFMSALNTLVLTSICYLDALLSRS